MQKQFRSIINIQLNQSLMAKKVTQPATIDDKEKQIRKLYGKKEKKVKVNTDLIFRVLSTVVTLGSVICFFNFFDFRDYCHKNGIYVISPISFLWATFGFAFHWFGRKWWTLLMEKRFQNYMHPRNAYYSPEIQQFKIETITKQGYDFIFHTVTTIAILVLFRKEPWFPMCTGGWGSCDAIFATYPNWPINLNPAVQIFYQFQLGNNLYILLQVLVFKRKDYKSDSYFELIFHHSVTIILILFSIGYNFVPIGIMMMFVHDSSDAVRAIGRVISESKYAIQYFTLSKIADYAYLAVWFYMRLLVLPLCLINSMYTASEDYSFLYLERYYLIALSLGIYTLQTYWIYFLARGSSTERKGNIQFVKWQAQQLKNESLGEEGRQKKKE